MDLKKISLTIYIIASLFVTIPLIIFYPHGLALFVNLVEMFRFPEHWLATALLFLGILVINLYDILFYNDREQFIKNEQMIRSVIGEKSILNYLLISILSGYFEEVLFRGYFYQLLLLTKTPLVFTFSLISFIFAILHANQGKIAFILSFMISLSFLLYVHYTGCIIIPIIFHALFNFFQLTFTIPYQKKKFHLQID
ncbi:MAG: CPBP family intramembrane metalloprotease [Spirochaetes bacterium]|nr:CPBP family intramembrane metalloprotease [Spirochaetota bacterium]